MRIRHDWGMMFNKVSAKTQRKKNKRLTEVTVDWEFTSIILNRTPFPKIHVI